MKVGVVGMGRMGAAYDGADGLLSGNVAGKLFIEMSTVRPEVGNQMKLTLLCWL